MLGSNALNHPALKSFAVIGSPFDHLIPSLKWNVHFNPSSETSHFSANPPTIFPSLSLFKSPSEIKSFTVPPIISVDNCGSTDAGSPPKFNVKVLLLPPLDPQDKTNINIVNTTNNFFILILLFFSFNIIFQIFFLFIFIIYLYFLFLLS